MFRQPIIIDTDPGQDDAFAILMALACHTALDVLGITAVCGNAGVKATAANALKILTLAGREDVPVFEGAAFPLAGSLVTAAALHGDAITQGWDLPASTTLPQPQFAVDWLIDTVMSRPAHTVTICALGPLTNIALALEKCPDIADRLKQLVLMGGSSRGGNMNAVAEFNVFVDAHAAAKVFASPVRKVVASLDVTSKLLITEEEFTRLIAAANGVGSEVRGLLSLYETYINAGAPRPLHDPAVITWLVEPGIFTGRELNVEIDTTQGFTYGQTIVDVNTVTGRAPNALWLTDVDARAFFHLLETSLAGR